MSEDAVVEQEHKKTDNTSLEFYKLEDPNYFEDLNVIARPL